MKLVPGILFDFRLWLSCCKTQISESIGLCGSSLYQISFLSLTSTQRLCYPFPETEFLAFDVIEHAMSDRAFLSCLK